MTQQPRARQGGGVVVFARAASRQSQPAVYVAGMRYALAVLVLSAAPALADPVPADFQRLCGSLDQSTCWIKAGSTFCPDRGRCDAIPETPAKVLDLRSGKLGVVTQFGRGTVPLSAIVTAEPQN